GKKKKHKKALKDCIERMRDLQRAMYADDSWSLLLVFQAMDAAGKDGTIRAVMSGVNPAGCQVYSFKKPSAEELDHDFLWRINRRLPERGRIGIFNRSHYEEVLAVRVHPEYLEAQKLPGKFDLEQLWKDRFESIRAFERHLARSGTVILKFWLNVSKEEQRSRFLDRIDEPESNWKFNPGDISERGHWDSYMEAYEDALNQTS
ncbi:MAG: polyphosphate kinase 2 family protein, partial [Phycisphaerales bacterium]|nr:polyphosphate kinase 2 family protein [Phycisphaerales bacterium]